MSHNIRKRQGVEEDAMEYKSESGKVSQRGGPTQPRDSAAGDGAGGGGRRA